MKSGNFLWWVIAVCILAVGHYSCTYYEIKPAKISTPDSVKFSRDIIPIFTTSCAKATCHVTGVQSPDLTAPNAYVSLTYFGYISTDDPTSSPLYQKITFGDMKDKATDQDRALILKWIEQGAPDN